MKTDKKAVNNNIQMVLLKNIAEPTVLNINDDVLHDQLYSFLENLRKKFSTDKYREENIMQKVGGRMIRGVRGATTVTENTETQILTNTKVLVEDMVAKNNITPDTISHVFISVTKEINAAFPAKSLRQIPNWT